MCCACVFVCMCRFLCIVCMRAFTGHPQLIPSVELWFPYNSDVTCRHIELVARGASLAYRTQVNRSIYQKHIYESKRTIPAMATDFDQLALSVQVLWKLLSRSFECDNSSSQIEILGAKQWAQATDTGWLSNNLLPSRRSVSGNLPLARLNIMLLVVRRGWQTESFAKNWRVGIVQSQYHRKSIFCFRCHRVLKVQSLP